MKILFVSNGYIPVWKYGGPIQGVHQLCRGLKESGEEVMVYATNPDGQDLGTHGGSDTAEVESVPVRYFIAKGLKRFGYSYDLARELHRNLRSFEIVHIQGIFVYPSMVAARLCQDLEIPYVVSPRGLLDPYCLRHHYFRKLLYYSLAEKKNLNRARFVHFTSSEERDRANRLHLKSPSAVIPNCLDIRPFVSSTLRGRFRADNRWVSDRRILLFLGRIHFKKGLDLLVQAFRNLKERHPDWILVIAGPDDGGCQAKISKRVSRLGISNEVFFIGLVVGQKKLELLADSDILVLPSFNENFGMAVAEGMAAGLPVVISNQVQIWREVEKSQAGLVCTCKVTSLQRSLQRLMGDPDLRKKMGQNGKNLVCDRYDIQKVVPQMRKLYHEALK